MVMIEFLYPTWTACKNRRKIPLLFHSTLMTAMIVIVVVYRMNMELVFFQRGSHKLWNHFPMLCWLYMEVYVWDIKMTIFKNNYVNLCSTASNSLRGDDAPLLGITIVFCIILHHCLLSVLYHSPIPLLFGTTLSFSHIQQDSGW